MAYRLVSTSISGNAERLHSLILSGGLITLNHKCDYEPASCFEQNAATAGNRWQLEQVLSSWGRTHCQYECTSAYSLQ